MMTEEEKSLLLKDLCARQPYGVMINTPLFEKPTLLKGMADNMCWAVVDEDNYEWVDIDDVKPYLHLMSSMTEEEENEYYALEELSRKKSNHGIDILDWLLSHHFDYRGLIEKGLALEASEGIYKIK